LWDARFYCLECVNQHKPDLLRHAASHEKLEETMLNSAWSVSRRFFLCFSVPLAGFGGLIALLVWWGGGKPLPIFLLLAMIGVPILLLFSASCGLSFHANRPVITARDGKLILRGGMSVVAAALTECHWFLGKQPQMNLFKYGFLFRGPCIIVDFHGLRFGVGFTEETRKTWKAFFTLSGAPKLPLKGEPQTQRGSAIIRK
jgi:hypothetical protein